MTSIAVPRELFEIGAVRSLRPQLLSLDGVRVEEREVETDADKIYAIVQQIAKIAHTEYAWSQSDIDNLLQSYGVDPDCNPQDEIGIVLVFSFMCYLQAHLAEESSRLSFWAELSPDDRQQLFAYAREIFERLPENRDFNELSDALRAEFDRASQKFGIDFGKLISGLNIHQNKFVENALRAKTIFGQLKTTVVPKSNSQGRLRELTPTEMEARAKKADAALERQRHRIASMSAEELALADYGLNVLDESLREARGIANWE
jgi:hypothetical protein